MKGISVDSIMSKAEAWSRTAKGKLRMKEVIGGYAKNGVGKTAAGGKVITESDIWIAASKLIDVLRSTARGYDLPASVLKHFDSLECSSIKELSDGSLCVTVYFSDDLSRESLYHEKYDEGLDNVITLFNNGAHAKDFVYGWWNNHKPTGESVFRSGVDANDAWIRSKKDRQGLHFIQQAVQDFNGNYGADYNVTAIAGDAYK